jgi:hypothetical protein
MHKNSENENKNLNGTATRHRQSQSRSTRAGLDFSLSTGEAAGVRKPMKPVWLASALVVGVLAGATLQAQVPTTLTDKIYKGNGTINLLKDISAANLQNYLTSNGSLFLGADLNEAESGNESRDSVGVAIKQLELVVTTTAGTFSFKDFVTSTTAMIRESGAASAQQFYTMFGKGGSSQLTGGPTGPDLASVDDVIRIRNVSFRGTLLSASLNVAFVDTAKSKTQGNETFFDYSGGFEDFALLGKKEALTVETANAGVAAAPSSVIYTLAGPTITAVEIDPPTAPGAPVPPLGLLLAMGAVVVWKCRRGERHSQT